MRVVLCDLCPREVMEEAKFHVSFQRLNIDVASDKPLDLCKRHYDFIFETVKVADS